VLNMLRPGASVPAEWPSAVSKLLDDRGLDGPSLDQPGLDGPSTEPPPEPGPAPAEELVKR
jgi:hypothetical protein